MRLYRSATAEHSEHGPTAFRHLSQTITLLNQKLSQEENRLIGSALYVVMTLLVMALFYEDMHHNLPSLSGMDQLGDSWDRRLVIIYRDLQYLTILINENVRRHTRLSRAVFQKFISSIQSRLLRLHKALPDPQAETLRLAMMAFLTTTLKIPGLRVSMT